METNKPQTVFLAIPTHDGRIDVRTAQAAYAHASKNHNLMIATEACSLLAHGFNILYCKALNERMNKNITWFAMLHSDIAPEAFWLDTMIELAEKHDADILSCVVPIKTPTGLTSTALGVETPYGPEIRRITQSELWNDKLPEVFSLNDLERLGFDGDYLLVNSGCMVIRLQEPWSDQLFFTIQDSIDRHFGQYVPKVLSEDWFLSRLAADKGAKVMATKSIRVLHMGVSAYDSKAIWGEKKDPSWQH